ncbi:MAG: HAD family hydrolase [Deltaproteobacteria bacterium]|nr:MAG: HAD family hydrolase [Deltaproteobacteria bacterium]
MKADTFEKTEISSDGAIKAVIFDCDGVILDSRAANAALYNRILSHFKRGPLTEEQLAFVHSHTLQESLKRIFREDSLVKAADQFWQEMDYGPISELLSLEPGLIECLELLSTRYKIAIATSRTRTMPQVLQRFGLNHYFDMVVTAADVRHPKPHPESLDKILAFFNIAPQQACYIGDSEVDREASQRAGVVFIAYRNENLEADHHLSRFSDLIPTLERLIPPQVG